MKVVTKPKQLPCGGFLVFFFLVCFVFVFPKSIWREENVNVLAAPTPVPSSQSELSN